MQADAVLAGAAALEPQRAGHELAVEPLGGYTNTAQGKVISAAFMDAFNQMVISLRNYKAQTVQGQGLGGGGRLGVDGAAPPSQTSAPQPPARKK